MSEGKTIFKQNIYSQSTEILGFASNLIFNVIFPVLLGSVLFGTVSLVLGFAYLLGSLITSGTSNLAMIFSSKYYKRDKARFKHHFAYLTRISLMLAFVASILLFLFSDSLALIYNMPEISYLLKISSFIVLFKATMSYFYTALIGMRRAQDSLIVSVFSTIGIIVFPFALYFNMGIDGFILGVAISYILAFIVSAILFRKNHPIEVAFNKKKVKRRYVFKEIVLFTILSFKRVFLRWVLLLILGLFVISSSEIAFFKVSMSWVSVVGTLIPISGAAMFASFVRLKEVDMKKLKYYLKKIINYSLVLMIPSIVGISLLGDKLILLIYGSEYLGAALPIAIMSLFIIFSFFDNIFYYIIASYDKLFELSKRYVISMIFSSIAAFVLMMEMGLIGASIAYVLSAILLFTASLSLILKYVWKEVPKLIIINSIRPAISAAMMGAFILWSMTFLHGIIGMALIIISSIFLYFVSMLAIKGIKYSDIKLLSRLLK